MEAANHEVLDISSDEEGGWSEPSNWLECLLDTIQKDDSDEVVVLGSTPGEDDGSKPKVKEDLDDDECLILDGDPDKPTEVAKEAADGSDGDDLLVVSEKGQIACRDYPHPRHLCARYPFSTNPHEKFCDLCHCYVCDIRAPCIYWGSGASITDHCHSNDKEDIWRLRRKCNKQGILAPLPAVKHPSKAYSTGPPLQNSVPAVLSQPLPNRNTSLHVLSRSNTLPTGSPARNFGVPNIISQHNHHQLGDAPNRIRLANGVSRSTSFSPSSSTVNCTTLDRLSGRLGPRFVSHFKRVGSGAVTLTKGRAVHSSCGNSNQVGSTYMVQQQQQQQQHPHPLPLPLPQAQAQLQLPLPHLQLPLPHLHPHQHPRAHLHHPHPHSHPHPYPLPQPQAQPQPQPQQKPQPQSHPRTPAQAQAQPKKDPHTPAQAQAQPKKYNTPASYNNIQSRSQVLRACPNTSQQHHNNYSTTTNRSAQPNVPSTMGQEVSAGACQLGSQSTNIGSFMDPQSYNVSLQSEVFDQPMVSQLTENVETYLVEDPTLNVPNQSLTNYELNFLNDAPQSFVSAVQYPETPSTQPSSNPSPVIETVPQCPVTASLASAGFDLESWINSLDDVPPESGKETLASPLGFIPVQSELPEEALWFDFENLHNYI